MAKLTEPQKLFIVKALACFDTPSEVASAVREAFGIAVDRRQVAEYNPTTETGRELGQKLRAVFEETRKAFLADVGTIPIANQSVRLRAIDRMCRQAEEAGNLPLAAQLLEQAAKETGGMFTNRRELSGANGGPIRSVAVAPMTIASFYADLGAEAKH